MGYAYSTNVWSGRLEGRGNLAAICEDGQIIRKLIFELPKGSARFIWMKLGQ